MTARPGSRCHWGRSAQGMLAGGTDLDLVDVDRGRLPHREKNRAGYVAGAQLRPVALFFADQAGLDQPGLEEGDAHTGADAVASDVLRQSGYRPLGGGAEIAGSRSDPASR